ncbi:MAG: DUF4832 domain-containing protein [Candidatus Cloacimonetes bacterium]|nr:DUF4832 domain-containing protein [Candidatus Cloacimonadota bacterium]
MKNLKPLFIFGIALYILSFGSVTYAADYWTAGNSGAWNDVWTWDGSGYPGTGDNAYINLGSTVTIDGTAELAGLIQIASWSGNSDPVTLELANGASLTISGDTYIGTAISGGYVDVGILNIDANSSFASQGPLSVGYNGSGTVNLNGGTVNANNGLYVSNPWAGSTGSGTVNLYSGTMVASEFVMSGTGLVNIETGELKIYGTSHVTYLNTLINGNQIVGYQGSGDVNISYEGDYTVLTATEDTGTTIEYTSSGDAIFNPERGFFSFSTLAGSVDYNAIRSQGYSLVYTAIDLSNFRASNISTSKLNDLSAGFTNIRNAGIKAIVRIIYDDTAAGEDATLAWIETHLQQLQPVLEDNSDIIAWFQAGIIGAWGEWHSSSNNHHLNPGPVWSLILQYFPLDKFIAVRTPSYVNQLESLDTNPLTSQEAFTYTSRARISHHNDCWLASDTDMGTYPPVPEIREQQKQQIENQSKYTPWGGESCCVSEYTNCVTALAEAERFHATYLDDLYHPDVIDELELEGCWDDEFAKKLGYRFELITSEFPSVAYRDKDFIFSIQLKNVGWAPLYNQRPVILRVLNNNSVIAEYQLTENADPRRWLPEDGVVTLGEPIRIPDTLSQSEVTFALYMPDEAVSIQYRPDYSVQFANIGVWDPIHGHNVLLNVVNIKDWLKGDFNEDDNVNLLDVEILAQNWLQNCDTPDWCNLCDIDESGTVNFHDFAEMSLNYNP